MNVKKTLVCLSLALLGASALAQGATPFDGEWVVQAHDASGAVGRYASSNIILDFKGGTGTYVNRSPNLMKSDSCLRVVADIDDVKVTDTTLEFNVRRSAKLPGCQDFRMRFTRDGDTITGRPVSMKTGAEVGAMTYIGKRN